MSAFEMDPDVYEPSYGDGPYDHLDNEPEGDDYMPDELYTDTGEIIPRTNDTDAARGLLAQLSAPFHPSLRKSRDVQGKQLWYYDYMVIQERLNTIAPNHTIHVVNEQFHQFGTTGGGNPRLILRATVELTIPGLGTRAGAGVQVVNAESGGEDLWKGHISDGIKKAAAGFGIGKELYVESGINQPEPYDPNRVAIQPGTAVVGGQQYPVQPQYSQPPVTRPTGPQNAPQPMQAPTGYGIVPPSNAQIGKIGHLGRELNITDEEMSTLAMALGFNLMAMSKSEASRLIDNLIQRQQSGG